MIKAGEIWTHGDQTVEWLIDYAPVPKGRLPTYKHILINGRQPALGDLMPVWLTNRLVQMARGN